jgi:hypothetical protein
MGPGLVMQSPIGDTRYELAAIKREVENGRYDLRDGNSGLSPIIVPIICERASSPDMNPVKRRNVLRNIA